LERKSTIRKLVSDDAIAAFEKDMVNIITDDNDKSKEDLQDELDRTRENLEKIEEQIENAVNKYAKAGISRARDPMLKRIKSLENQIENYSTEAKLDNETEESPEDTEDNAVAEAVSDRENTYTPTNNNDGTNIKFSNITGETFTLDSKGIRDAVSIGLRQPERINAPIGTYLPRIMFAMMPFSMLLGAIFIRGREKAMLFDHLVHAAYIHAFSFLLLFVFMLLVQFTPIKGLLWIYTFILLIYLPLSARRMFGRGWFKTVLTSYGVGAIYTFNMMIILSFLIGMGLSDIVKDVGSNTPL